MNLNHDFMLLSRKGQLLLGQVSGLSQPIPLHEPDIFLLHSLLKNRDVDQAVSAFASDQIVRKLVPNIAPGLVKQRIQQLQTFQLFEPSVRKTALDIDQSEIRIIADSPSLPEALCISNNFGIFLSSSGYYAYSSAENGYVTLPVAWVYLMQVFRSGATCSAVIREKSALFSEDIQSILKTLYHHGLLIEKSQPAQQNAQSIQNQYARIAGKPKIKNWKQIAPDKRIPVYFVPHMENHYPLALGVLYSALKNHDNGRLLNHFQLVPITYLKPNDLFNGPYKKFRTGIWLFSNYMWSLDINLQISNAIKNHDSRNLTIHGGPSTPDYPGASQKFMQANSSVDVCVHGEGEVAICQIFEHILELDNETVTYAQAGLQDVPGITYRGQQHSELIRTAPRIRMDTPDQVPSPYLSGLFDVYEGRVEAAIIESNRGCPFGCTFCDWGSATNQKVRKIDLDRVKQEIEWIGKNKVRVIWIADANFGLYDRDIELSQVIVDTKKKYGYPQEVVVNYTKNSTWRLVEIIKIFTAGNIISQGIISIQTTDEATLEVINRKNIKTQKYDELVKVFYDLKLPLSTDLMIGLPGITVDAFNNDLQRYIDMDVSVKAYPTQLLPNSPMADPEYIEKYKIKVDQNDFVKSSFSFTEEELQHMKGMYHIYTMADGYSLLRYVIRYLQWEYDIRAIDFLQDMLRFVQNNAGRYPQISWAVKFFNQDKCMPGGWTLFYQQIAEYLQEVYAINQDTALQTILEVSQLCMPDDTRIYPLEVELKHDFTAYFSARSTQSAASVKSLRDYSPAKFHVSDPNSMVSIDLDYLQYDSHQYFWELHSNVSRPKSVSDFSTAV